MIEQLWYTWSTVGLGSVTGFRVRAASPGLSDIRSGRFRALEPLLHYNLPIGIDPYEASTANSPRCLALFDVGDKRILLQKVYVGKDGYNRPGVHFVHLLEGLPSTFSARDAIQCWCSPFWQVSDQPEASSELSTLDDTRLNQVSTETFNTYDQSSMQESLVFTIHAYLSLKPYQRLYLAAPAEQVAVLIWNLARCLPSVLQKQITFSTYENDVHDVDAHIIGTYWAPEAHHDLPSECYDSEGLALNSFSGKHSPLNEASLGASYASFAVKCLASGEEERLKELLNTANKMSISTSASFLALYDIFTTESRSKEQVTSILQTYELAAGLLRQEDIQTFILQLARNDPQWWKESGAPAIAELCIKQQKKASVNVQSGLNALAEKAATSAADAFLNDDTKTVIPCLNVLFTSAPPASNPDPWIHMLRYCGAAIQEGMFDPAKFKNWSVRAWLLQRCKETEQPLEEHLILPWLQVAWSELDALLQLPLPERWHVLAITDLLKRSSERLPSDIASLALKHQALFESSVKYLMRDSETQRVAYNLFPTLVKQNYPGKMGMLSLLLHDELYIDDLLQVAQLTDKEKVEGFEAQAQLFLAPRSLSPRILDLVAVYLSCLAFNNLSSSATRQALKLLQNNIKKLPEENADQVRDWNVARDAILQEQGKNLILFDAQYLTMLGRALRHLQLYNKEAYRQKLFSSLSKSVNTAQDLQTVVETLSPLLEVSRQDFLYFMAKYRGSLYSSATSYSFLEPYIIVTCTYANDPQVSIKKQYLIPILRALLKNADRSVFNKIEKAAREWPPEAQKIWNAHREDVKQSGIKAFVGDIRQFFPTMPQMRAPIRQNVTQTTTHTTAQTVVARIWLPTGPKPISSAHFKKMHLLQDMYIPARRRALQKMTPKYLWIDDEQDLLDALDDPKRKEQEIREFLINDLFILRKLEELENMQMTEHKPRSILNKSLEETLQDIRKQKDYQQYIRKVSDKQQAEQDVEDMLSPFLRYQHLAQYLWQQRKRLPEWLKEQKRKITIERY